MTTQASKISEIKITEEKGFFANKNFQWHNISNFSVIAGVNGSGKTKLLQYINNKFKLTHENLPQTFIMRYIGVGYMPQSLLSINGGMPSISHQFFINNKDNTLKILNIDGDTISTERSDLVPSIFNKMNLPPQASLIDNLDRSLVHSIINERRKFILMIKEYKEELDKLENLETTTYKEAISKLLPEDPKNDKPWDKIDRIFSDFDLPIRIDRTNLNNEITFIRYPYHQQRLKISDLSTGEQVAFSLALWTWGNTIGQTTEVLLIDEFDAHLNPTIAKKFIDIIKKYFIDNAVQVFMTTHNPSTIIYAKKNEANIIWMQDGIIDKEKEYQEIIHDLSNGLIDVLDDFYKEIQLIIKDGKKCVVYTEGKTDKQYIEDAIQKLGRSDEFKDIYIFGSTGALSIKTFIKTCIMNLPTDNQIKIALFDNDKAGQDAKNEIFKDEELKRKLKKGNIKTLLVSEQENATIESLFPAELLEEKKQSYFQRKIEVLSKKEQNDFKSYLAKQQLKTEDYGGFTNLLDEILKLSSKSDNGEVPNHILQ